MKKPYPAILDDPELGIESRKLKGEAASMLERMEAEGLSDLGGLSAVFPAASRGDDIVLYADEGRARVLAVFPCLRQQRVKEDGSSQLCLADYLAPEGVAPDWMGLFVATAGRGAEEAARKLADAGDDFGSTMIKILCDRLAEALAERLHQDARRTVWGYAPDEAIAPPDLRLGAYRGIRPAPGYPACPDHRDKAAILDLLGAKERLGMSLTESFMMVPPASVSGFYFSHPDSKYFAIGGIGDDQIADYAARRGESIEEAAKAVRESLG